MGNSFPIYFFNFSLLTIYDSVSFFNLSEFNGNGITSPIFAINFIIIGCTLKIIIFLLFDFAIKDTISLVDKYSSSATL